MFSVQVGKLAAGPHPEDGVFGPSADRFLKERDTVEIAYPDCFGIGGAKRRASYYQAQQAGG